MSRTEADQREYLLAACDCLEAGNLEAFRKLRTQWRAGGSITALQKLPLDQPTNPDEQTIAASLSLLSAVEPDGQASAWKQLETLWKTFPVIEKSAAMTALAQLREAPSLEIQELASRGQLVLQARESIALEWPKSDRLDLLSMFFVVLLKPLRLTVEERHIIRNAFGIDQQRDVRLTYYCQRLKTQHPELAESAGESLDSLTRVEPRAQPLVNGKRPLSTGMKIALGAMIISPIVRFALMEFAKDPPPPPRVDPQMLAQRKAETDRLMKSIMNSPSPAGPPPQLKISIVPPRTTPELEAEFQAFCQLCDQQNHGSTPREMLAAMQQLREMRRKEPARFEQFAFERMHRLAAEAPPNSASNQREASPSPDDLRKLHVLTLWTERDRKAGVADSAGEQALLKHMRSLGPRLTTVMSEYRRRLDENPKAFPSLETLERDAEIPRLHVSPSLRKADE